MKTIFIAAACLVFAASAYSQSVRITFNGNRDYQLKVDGRTYNSSNYMNNDLVLNNFSGNHNISIYRTNRKGKSRMLYSSDVAIAPNEEIHLIVNQNGTIQREESSSSAAYGYRSPMSETSFNDVYNRINNQWGESAKMYTARDLLNSGNYYFSTDQARRLIALLNSEQDRLELAKLTYDHITDPSNFSQVYDLLNSQSRNELDDYVRNNGYNGAYNNYRVAMSNSSFGQLYRNISRQWSTSARMNAATDAFNSGNNYFTVAQASQIISLLNTENDRLQLAKLAVNNIVDRENINQLYNLLSTQTARDDLYSYITNNNYSGNNYGYNYNNNYHPAMNDADFSSLYDNIRKKWLPFGKYNAAVEAFNSSDNYFTTEQVRQIISLLSDESNRLELAKLAYDNVVDKQNFRNLYTLFDKQQSKDELDDFIRNIHY